MKESLFVHIRITDGSTVLAGQCVRDAERGVGGFRYHLDYLKHPQAFALDPINLPLGSEQYSFRYDRENPGLPGAILDAGPDDWGRMVMTLTRKPPPTTDIDFLLAGSGTGVGVLLFTATRDEQPTQTPVRPFERLDDVFMVASLIDKKFEVNDEQAQFFRRGSSLGGARPKTLIEHDGNEWLLKFPKDADTFDNPLVEHLTMQMAARAGIVTAETRIINTDRGNVLMVRRFDQENGKPHHLISMHSLINVFALRDIKSEDFSYRNIASLANSLADGDSSYNEVVFRRMAFNVATGNTDDHMRNHALMKPIGHKGFQLTPAYDLVPSPSLVGSHAISVGPMGNRAEAHNIISASREMGLSVDTTKLIIGEVLAALENWEIEYANEGLSVNDIRTIKKSMDYGQTVLGMAGALVGIKQKRGVTPTGPSGN